MLKGLCIMQDVQCALYNVHSVCNVHVGIGLCHTNWKNCLCRLELIHDLFTTIKAEPVLLNVCGAQESIPRNGFRQPM